MSNDAVEAEQSPKGTRPPGRPRGRFDPRLDWDLIEREYVTGIAGEPTNSSHVAARHWPTFRELGARHDVSHARVHQKSKRYQWKQRREIAKQNYAIHLDEAIVKAAALSTAEQVGYLDDYIRRFGRSIQEGKVRVDVITDLDRAARLREFLLGNADTRTESNHKLSLVTMQERFKSRQGAKVQAGDALAAAALAGVIEEQAPGTALMPPSTPTVIEVEAEGEGTIAGSTENSQSSTSAVD